MNRHSVIFLGNNALQNKLLASYASASGLMQARAYQSAADLRHSSFDIVRDLIVLDCLSADNHYVTSELSWFGDDLLRMKVALLNVRRDDALEHYATIWGIRGIFYDDVALEALLQGLRKLLDGEMLFSPDVVMKYLLPLRGKLTLESGESPLTDREKQIIRLVATGARNETIAESLCVSPHTVKTHIYHIFKKINVTNRIQAAQWAEHYL